MRLAGLTEQLARLLAPFPVHHQRQAIDNDVQKTADDQPDEGCADNDQKFRQLCCSVENQITAPILKIGRYIAITSPPTSTPRIAMISGSSRLLRPSTALSTSSS